MTTLEMLSAQELWDGGERDTKNRCVGFAKGQRPISIVADERFSDLLKIAAEAQCACVEIVTGRCIFYDYIPSSALMILQDYNRISGMRFNSVDDEIYAKIQMILSEGFEMPDPQQLFLYDLPAGMSILPN